MYVFVSRKQAHYSFVINMQLELILLKFMRKHLAALALIYQSGYCTFLIKIASPKHPNEVMWAFIILQKPCVFTLNASPPSYLTGQPWELFG